MNRDPGSLLEQNPKSSSVGGWQTNRTRVALYYSLCQTVKLTTWEFQQFPRWQPGVSWGQKRACRDRDLHTEKGPLTKRAEFQKMSSSLRQSLEEAREHREGSSPRYEIVDVSLGAFGPFSAIAEPLDLSAADKTAT